MEGRVLFRVEHFEQGGGRVAIDRCLRHLVNLVEYEHGIAGTGFLHAFDDSSGHSTDIGAAVPTNFSLVVKAA